MVRGTVFPTCKFLFIERLNRIDQIIESRKKVRRQKRDKLRRSSKFFIRVNVHTPKPPKAQLRGLNSGDGTKENAQVKKMHVSGCTRFYVRSLLQDMYITWASDPPPPIPPIADHVGAKSTIRVAKSRHPAAAPAERARVQSWRPPCIGASPHR